MALLIDHLWQSVLFFALVACLSWLTRRNSAALRLWLWRTAALKFLLPFSLLFALGGWLGFPVRHSAIPPPTSLAEAVATGLRLTAPAQTLAPANHLLIGGLVLLLLATGLCGLLILRKLRRAPIDSQETMPLGFVKTITLGAAGLFLVSGTIVAGAVKDRLRRQEALALDMVSLRTVAISLRETPHRFGARPEILASGTGVAIRQTNLQDLVALVYGIGEFEVFGGALPWLESPHYNVQVNGPISAPGIFDPYALRQPVTDFLYKEYGVSIRVNGSCQEPCSNQQSFTIQRLR